MTPPGRASDGKHTLVLGLPQNSIIPLKQPPEGERPPTPPPAEEPEDQGG